MLATGFAAIDVAFESCVADGRGQLTSAQCKTQVSFCTSPIALRIYAQFVTVDYANWRMFTVSCPDCLCCVGWMITGTMMAVNAGDHGRMAAVGRHVPAMLSAASLPTLQALYVSRIAAGLEAKVHS